MIFRPPADFLSVAINHLLAHEAWARAKLMPHAGKVAVFDARLVTVRLKVSADGMVETAGGDEAATVTIRAQLSNLLLIVRNRKRAFSYVKIDGDADFANTISQLSQSLRWDAEGDLAGVVGDIAARRVVMGARSAVDAAKSLQRSISENAAEYFLEENPMLMRPQAIAEFTQDVTRLRDDVARLAKRIEKLKDAAQ